jgi:predicted O-methyltransferase YrrM
MSRTHIQLTDELAAYLRDVSLHEPEVLRKLREETGGMEMGGMQITPEQGQFMRLLVRMLGATKVLEVGTFTGYSSISMALGMPAAGKIVCCDISEEWTSVARRYWREAGVESRIELHLGPALHALERLLSQGEKGSFDFAFIDADKVNYSKYLDHAYTLLRPGGVAGIDNVLWHGRVIDAGADDADTQAIREFNQKLAKDERFAISMLPVGDGLTLAMKL